MSSDQHTLYARAGELFAPAIARLARAFERDREKARDLEQDIHAELWRSFARFDGRCSLKTWTYRVAHNVAADHVAAASRRPEPVPLDAIESLPEAGDAERQAAENLAIERVRERTNARVNEPARARKNERACEDPNACSNKRTRARTNECAREQTNARAN